MDPTKRLRLATLGAVDAELERLRIGAASLPAPAEPNGSRASSRAHGPVPPTAVRPEVRFDLDRRAQRVPLPVLAGPAFIWLNGMLLRTPQAAQ